MCRKKMNKSDVRHQRAKQSKSKLQLENFTYCMYMISTNFTYSSVFSCLL